MKAIAQHRYGSPDDLEIREVDVPDVREEEVLVRVRAASLHPDVWHVVCGRSDILRLMGGGISRPRNPIPGTDMAGIVAAVGRRVSRFHPGDPVFGETIPGTRRLLIPANAITHRTVDGARWVLHRSPGHGGASFGIPIFS